MPATIAITVAPPSVSRTTCRSAAEVLFAAPLLTLGALGLWQAVLVVWASFALSQAAAAGAREAALPHANRASIEAAVDRALTGRPYASRRGPIEIAINDWPAGDASLPFAASGDRICIRVELPASAVAPDLLRCVGLTLAHDTLTAAAIARKR